MFRLKTLPGKGVATLCAALGFGLSATSVLADDLDLKRWGEITTPVYGSKEAGLFSDAELFAGPNKFGSYYSGVLPNGRLIKPVGTITQVGMDPLGFVLTPDGKYLITSNDDERDSGEASLQNPTNQGGYTLSVIDTATMKVISQVSAVGNFFIGIQATGAGPYTVWASGGTSNNVKLFSISPEGAITGPTSTIIIPPLTPQNAGFVSNYTPNFKSTSLPTGFSATGAKLTVPAGSALSPDGKYLYVACQGDNSVAVIDTTTQKIVKQVAVGYFPYGISVSSDGSKILAANWGIQEYKFKNPIYDADGKLIALGTTGQNMPDGFYTPKTSTTGANPKTSSISVLDVENGDGGTAKLRGSIYQGKPLNQTNQIGDTHPSATAIVRQGKTEVLYITKANSDSIGLIQLHDMKRLPDFDLSPLKAVARDRHPIHGSYPNAVAVSPDNTRAYVAEAGFNSIAVLDTSDPIHPRLLGRIPTDWYPTGVTVSHDGGTLYVLSAKGIGEDINPLTDVSQNHHPTGVESFDDSNFLFGTVQKIDLSTVTLENTTVLHNNFAINSHLDTRIVPVGGKPSQKIKHVFFILKENKSFDSMLGNQSAHFGPYASTTFNNRTGAAFIEPQNTGVALNLQLLARTFATGVNYYSDSEESDAGHQFASSGTATDYMEKTIVTKAGRGLHINKNMEAEDYPESGYIFNNAARNGVSFKDYGDLIRNVGTDTGSSVPTTINDPKSGNAGYPQLQADKKTITQPLVNLGDTDSPVSGMGQSYFLAVPTLAVLGTANKNGEPHLDKDYPGYNFNISDQRRAKKFCADFDRMLAAGTLPQFLYIYLPNDHGGGIQAPNKNEVGGAFLQQVADGDVALGMVLDHVLKSSVYYNAQSDTGSAIFITWDDAQSSLDHIHPHRTPLVVVSPFAKKGYLATRHYSTASIVKTEELLLGLPPNNYGDLFATDLRDMFQPTYNGITAADLTFARVVKYKPSSEGKRIWSLVNKLDLSGPDRDSLRLGRLARLSSKADRLHATAMKTRQLAATSYREAQKRLYRTAIQVVTAPAPRDTDD